MRSGRFFNKIFLTLLIITVLFVSVACSAGNNEVQAVAVKDVNTSNDTQLETIDSEQLPLAAQTTVATAKATFNDGGSVNTTSMQTGSVTLNTNLADKGIVGIKADVESAQKLKVKVALGEQKVYYDITPGQMIKVPMQFGNGTYRVELYENISGSDYTGLFGQDVDISIGDSNEVFLNSSQIVNYEDSTDSYPLAQTLMQGGSDMDTLTAAYNYVVNNISYDYDKMNNVDSSYIPNIDSVLKSKKGICYDYAAVLASLLREAGIPAKLVMGYRSDLEAYHAWNQVMIEGQWVTVDATFGAVMLQNGKSDDVVKEASLYSAEKVF